MRLHDEQRLVAWIRNPQWPAAEAFADHPQCRAIATAVEEASRNVIQLQGILSQIRQARVSLHDTITRLGKLLERTDGD